MAMLPFSYNKRAFVKEAPKKRGEQLTNTKKPRLVSVTMYFPFCFLTIKAYAFLLLTNTLCVCV